MSLLRGYWFTSVAQQCVQTQLRGVTCGTVWHRRAIDGVRSVALPYTAMNFLRRMLNWTNPVDNNEKLQLFLQQKPYTQETGVYIHVQFPDQTLARVPISRVARDTGRGIHGREYLQAVAKDQANGAAACPAEMLGDTVVLC